MAIKMVFGNQKGGVGKSTCSYLFTLLLSLRGHKVLLIDMDKQANSTHWLINTFNKLHLLDENTPTIQDAIVNQDFRSAIMPLSENVDIIPNGKDLDGIDIFLYKMLGDENHPAFNFYLRKLVSEVEGDYDFIIWDTPPTQNTYTKNALAASDYAIGVVKCETSSLNGAKDFQDTTNTLGKIMDAMKLKPVQFAGVIIYLFSSQGTLRKEVVEDIKAEFGELAYENIIKARDRIERYTKTPIDLDNKLDHHDKNALQMYDDLLNEIIEKVGIDYAKGQSEPNAIF